MYYIKQSNNCNFRNLEVSEEKGGGNLSNYICSKDKDKLLYLVQELRNTIDDFGIQKIESLLKKIRSIGG